MPLSKAHRWVPALVLIAALALAAPAALARAHPGADSYPPLLAGPASFVHHHNGRRNKHGHRSHSARSSSKHAKPRSTKRRKPRLSPAELLLRENVDSAILAYQVMQKYFYVQGTGLYKGQPYSYLWPFSQALAATVDLMGIPAEGARFRAEVHARLVGLEAYFDANNSGANEGAFTSSLPGFDGSVAPPKGSGGAKYYDDNEWVGIELVRVYEQTGEAQALEHAEQIMAFVMSGWQADAKLACPGGEPFSNSAENGTRNTVTTAPGAELAVQLYRLTGEVEYLRFAEMAYAWVRECLLLSTGLYADHIGAHGIVESTEWSYNQGTMIGAGVLLYQASGNATYLAQASQTASAALAYFTLERLAGENPFFVAVYLRNLLYLDAVTGEPPGPQLAQSYVDYLGARYQSNGLFSTSAYQPQLLVQAAVTQIYAMLGSSPASYF
ncbi:MAG TPA: glycoside hydrolase family 76 protein [Solirubrobacteraceae bacterium]